MPQRAEELAISRDSGAPPETKKRSRPPCARGSSRRRAGRRARAWSASSGAPAWLPATRCREGPLPDAERPAKDPLPQRRSLGDLVEDRARGSSRRAAAPTGSRSAGPRACSSAAGRCSRRTRSLTPVCEHHVVAAHALERCGRAAGTTAPCRPERAPRRPRIAGHARSRPGCCASSITPLGSPVVPEV